MQNFAGEMHHHELRHLSSTLLEEIKAWSSSCPLLLARGSMEVHSIRLGALASQCPPPKGHQAQPAAHPFPHHVPRAPRRQVDPTHRGDVETETIHFPKCNTHKGTWNTETIHFTQVGHHPKSNDRPTHDASEGSRTPGNNTGEERPRKEWSILVTFSVTPVPTEHSSDLASPYCGQTVH